MVMAAMGKTARTDKKGSGGAAIPAEPAGPDPAIRQILHGLIDRLDPTDETTARRVLEALVAQAEYDDEPLTPEEEAASEQGWQEYLRGEAHPLDEVLRDIARKWETLAGRRICVSREGPRQAS